MQHKWKYILTNWINCYINETSEKEQCVDLESLLNIISHLHENLNLEESKSSKLEAHTVEDFIHEKYPAFKFDNGTTEATNEEEIYIAASLLLFFVCVNSKDMDIKSVMCSKLSPDDQETILKFSKRLMECSPVSYSDVQSAITDACGQDIAAGESAAGHAKVAETPPVLRSLHNEVRRLQAALEAERFDRNYLQEELARKNLRLDKLLKEKEQHKLDIMNLKAKISLCCGQQEELQGEEVAHKNLASLQRQLQDMEERLVATQGELDDIQYERDTYKNKVDELKKDRDKWVSVSQQETSRAEQLANELETCQLNVKSLCELVSELRQHNQKNCLDSSQLECDDPDATIHSPHNASVCSEACANVVEVQLVEERAKIVLLKQQINTLQEQLNELSQRANSDKQLLESTISEKEAEVFSLRHRVNEEIEEKNTLKSHFNDEVSKLNNEINEMDQKLRHALDNSKLVIEQKMQEIQNIQLEKLTLLQTLSNETNKFEKIIKDLSADIDTEKNLKLKMKEDYENCIMKLNEKVLNRNNELVELQNNICEKSEMIEKLHYNNKIKENMEKQLKEERQKYSQLEHIFDTNTSNLMAKLNEKEKVFKELQSRSKNTIEENNLQIKTLMMELEKMHKILKNDRENQEIVKRENQVLLEKINEEITYKKKIEKEYQNQCTLLKNITTQLTEEITRKNEEIGVLKKEVQTLSKAVEEKTEVKENMEKQLKEERQKYSQLEHIFDTNTSNLMAKLNEKEKVFKELQSRSKNTIEENNLQIKTLMMELEKMHKILKNDRENQEIVKRENQVLLEKINEEITYKNKFEQEYQNQCTLLKNITTQLTEEITRKNEEIGVLKKEVQTLSKAVEEKTEVKENMEKQLKEERQKYSQLEHIFDTNTSDLMAKLIEKEKVFEELQSRSKNTIEENNLQIKTLMMELEKMHKILKNDRENQEIVKRENQVLLEKINEEITYKNKFEQEYQNQCTLLKNITTQLTEEITRKNEEIGVLKKEVQTLSKAVEEKTEVKENMEKQLKEERQKYSQLEHIFDTNTSDLMAKLIEKEKVFEELQSRSKNTIEENNLQIKTLMMELEKMHKILKNDRENQEIVKRENQVLLEKINEEITYKNKFEQEYQNQCTLLKNITTQLTEEITRKNEEIGVLKKEVQTLSKAVEEKTEVKENMEKQLKEERQKYSQLEHIFDTNTSDLMAKLIEKEKVFEELQSRSKNTIEENNLQIKTLMMELEKMHKILKNDRENQEIVKRENQVLLEKINEEITYKNKFEQEYQNQCTLLKNITTQLTEEITRKNEEIGVLKKEVQTLSKAVEEKTEVKENMEKQLKEERQKYSQLEHIFDTNTSNLMAKLNEKEKVFEELQSRSKNTIQENNLQIKTLMMKLENMHKILKNDRENQEIVKRENQVLLEKINEEITYKNKFEKEYQNQCTLLKNITTQLTEEITRKNEEIGVLKKEVQTLSKAVEEKTEVKENMEKQLKEERQKYSQLEHIFDTNTSDLMAKLNEKEKVFEELQSRSKNTIEENNLQIKTLMMELEKMHKILKNDRENQEIVKRENQVLLEKINEEITYKNKFEQEYQNQCTLLKNITTQLTEEITRKNEEIGVLKKEVQTLSKAVEEKTEAIIHLEQHIEHEVEKKNKVLEDMANNRINLENKCSLLEEYQTKAEKQLAEKDKDILSLQECIESLRSATNTAELEIEDMKLKLDNFEQELKDKNTVISSIKQELVEEKVSKEKYERELQLRTASVYELNQKLEEGRKTVEQLELLRKQSDEMKLTAQREAFAVTNQEKTSSRKYSGHNERDLRDQHQVSSSTSDFAYSSTESVKTITDLEKIIQDKNRTITTLQSDVTYLKSLMAESENKLLDVTKELEMSKENCDQLSSQLAKIVYQKNEEIGDLKKQVTKMGFTENRATQIIKVSAKYQAIILKRIAEIKSNTVLKELTNFGNTANCDNELRRGLTSGTITMEDLENFLETTDRHLKRCSEKQLILQKERDRLTEVNRINESEIINLKKFLTELSVSFKTFSSIKDLYTQKLSRVVSVQRTVRREILNLEGRVTDAMLCKLERGYAAVMQDLSECAMNLERWMERCIGRTISTEKIKQAFTSEDERSSLASKSFQNTSLEVQLEELDKSFQKLLEEVVRAQKGEGAKDPQAVTVMEVRAEYEDKLNRMKTKMKQLYQEQISVFKEKQKEEMLMLERELQKALEKQMESSRAYEEHIRALTMELWSVGEKLLVKKDEAEWLRRQQRSESLMSLQHVHSSGLGPHQVQPPRQSDSHSLRSLPVHTNNREKREARGLHMSDEEGEVFDNRFLRELATTPRRDSHAPLPAHSPGQRLSELRWRNSLCPPHLRSCYPAETQFALTSALGEEDIKCPEAAPTAGKQQRKEVGITAYKKPGPPTPSKQAGRLSATDSELRESLRVDPEPQTSRKTNTPSRLRALFRYNKTDADGTPRSRRLSNMFRKK